MTYTDDRPKIGAGHASAMFRQGLAELRGALYPESNVAQPPQYGLYGTRTPGEVMQERAPDAHDPDEQPHSVLASRLPDFTKGKDRQERDSRNLERD